MSFKRIISRAVVIGALVSSMYSMSVFAATAGVVVGNNVNVRIGDSASSDVVSVLDNGKSVTILSIDGDWCNVSFDSVNSAYISKDFIKVTNVGANVKGSGVNIRSSSSVDSEVVEVVNTGHPITVVGQTSDWYKLSTNGGQAFINKEFVEGSFLEMVPKVTAVQQPAQVQNTYAIITASSGLKLRESASTEANALSVLPYDEVVDVIEGGSQWIKVKTGSGATGYVSAEFVSVRTGEKPSRSNSSKGDQVIAYAKQFVGTPYVWGGTNLSSGVDCSGFVYAVFKNFGITLNRSSAGMAGNGVPVSKAELIVGDLILFDTTGPNDGGISHVGIYMGGGKYIHCSSGKEYSVTISDLNNEYGLRTYVTARRVLR